MDQSTQAHLLSLLHKKLHKRLALVLNLVVKHSIFQTLLEGTHLTSRLKMEHLHNLVAVNDRLKQTLVVTFLKVSNLLANHTEVL